MLSSLVELEPHTRQKKRLVLGVHFYVDDLMAVSNLLLEQEKVKSC